MQVTQLLDKDHVKYEIREHRPVFQAQRLAQEEHVKGTNVAKPVIVKADGQFYMCVIPACCNLDLETVKSILASDSIELVDEAQFEKMFPDCELGAEPPFGSIYGLPVLLDDRLENDEFIVFQAGTHTQAIKMSMAEYKRMERPAVFSFSYHV